MIDTKYILVLANSARTGKHCVAGKVATPQRNGSWKTEPQWIRLTDPTDPEGAVPFVNTLCLGHGPVRPLDIIKVILQRPCGDPNHPEDWYYEPGQRWEFVQHLPADYLPAASDTPPRLWHDGEGPRTVFAGYVPQMGAEAATLHLIKAPPGWTFTYWKEWNPYDKRHEVRRRLSFTYAGRPHEFSVTDTAFTTRHSIYELATESPRTVQVTNSANVYFCLSLTKLTPKFNRKHYKICATILET